MHIHPPKPLHGWRAFIGEVGIVVIGILIALTAEEALSEYNWERRVERAEVALQAEAADASMNYIEQLTVGPCIVAQIDELHTKIVAGGRWTGVPIYDSLRGRDVIRAPSRVYDTDAWTSLLADGTAAHMNPSRRAVTASYYSALADIRSGMPETQSLMDSLVVLAEPAELDATSRFQTLQTLGRLRNRVGLVTLSAAQNLSLIRDLGRLPPATTIGAYFAHVPAYGTRNVCASRHLPLGDWRKELADQPVQAIPAA